MRFVRTIVAAQARIPLRILLIGTVLLLSVISAAGFA